LTFKSLKMRKYLNFLALNKMPYLPDISKLIIPALVLFLTCLMSCNPAGNRNKASVLQGSVFKPDPEKLEHQEVKTLEPGADAPDFNLPDVTGKYYSLKDFSDSKILVVIFTCNHCPTAQAYEDRIIQFTKDYKKKGVSVVAIMPTSPLVLLLEEWR